MGHPDKEITENELTVGSILKFLLLNKKLITLCVAVFVLLVMAYSFIAPNQYSSGASLLPPEDSRGMGDLTSFLQTLSGGISLGSGGGGNKLLIFQEILKSRELAKLVVEDLELVKKLDFKPDNNIEDLYTGVSNMLKVELKRSGLITITSFASTSYFPNTENKEEAAKLSADIVNSAIKALDVINRTKTMTKAKKKRQFIEKMLVKKGAELDSIDALVEDFRKSNQIFSIDDQNQALIQNAIKIGAELAEAEIELNLRRIEYEENSPIVAVAKQKYNQLSDQFNRLQQGGIIPNDKLSIPLENVPNLIRQYQNLMRDQKIIEQIKLYLETQRYQEAIQEESDVPTVEALDYAQVPKYRIAPKRKVMFIFAFFLSLIGSSVFVIVRGIYQGHLLVKKKDY